MRFHSSLSGIDPEFTLCDRCLSDDVAGEVKSGKVKGAKVGTKPHGGRRGRLQLSRPRVAPYGLR